MLTEGGTGPPKRPVSISSMTHHSLLMSHPSLHNIVMSITYIALALDQLPAHASRPTPRRWPPRHRRHRLRRLATTARRSRGSKRTGCRCACRVCMRVCASGCVRRSVVLKPLLSFHHQPRRKADGKKRICPQLVTGQPGAARPGIMASSAAGPPTKRPRPAVAPKLSVVMMVGGSGGAWGWSWLGCVWEARVCVCVCCVAAQ